jgi:RNA polymerase sigma-70 factor (ECF subfamily)
MEANITLELLKKIANGDEQAMKNFFELHSSTVYHYIIGRCNDKAVAGDILNTVMMEVWNHSDRFEGRSKVSTWLIGIARFKLIDFYRSEKRHQHNELDETIEDPISANEQMIEAAQHSKGVRSCIDRLGENQREIVQLTFYSELAYQEIAEIIECPVGTVKSRMHHAKEALKRCLQSFLAMEGDHVLV